MNQRSLQLNIMILLNDNYDDDDNTFFLMLADIHKKELRQQKRIMHYDDAMLRKEIISS